MNKVRISWLTFAVAEIKKLDFYGLVIMRIIEIDELIYFQGSKNKKKNLTFLGFCNTKEKTWMNKDWKCQKWRKFLWHNLPDLASDFGWRRYPEKDRKNVKCRTYLSVFCYSVFLFQKNSQVWNLKKWMWFIIKNRN